MKHFKILFSIFLITTTVKSQTYIQFGLTNQGMIAGLGYTAENGAVLQATYSTPLTSTEVPGIASLSAGYEWLLSQKDQDNFTLTTLVGFASHNYTDAGKYLGYQNKIGSIYTGELSKDWYMGRLYISASFSKSTYFGAGIKIFFTRHK